MPCPPILFITFDRVEITKQVFERIRQAKPDRLHLVSDGAKPDRRGQERQVQEIRNYLSENVDWECTVKKLFRDKNWGCDKNIPDAVHWFFENEESGLILEDDCLPDPTFFTFCDILLSRYKNCSQVTMISGDCFLKSGRAGKEDYFFSKLSYSWGWATWRDRWKNIEKITTARSEINNRLIPRNLKGTSKKFWSHQIDVARQGQSTWDVDWQLALWKIHGVSILPARNLITNIGVIGTHMKPYDPCINLPTEEMPFPLSHPVTIETSNKRDAQTEKLVRRSFLKNIELILKYGLLLPFQRNESFLKGIRKLIHSLIIEAKSRQA
jgi:hypothetical protein